jgi:hypothetical protein
VVSSVEMILMLRAHTGPNNGSELWRKRLHSSNREGAAALGALATQLPRWEYASDDARPWRMIFARVLPTAAQELNRSR